MKHKLRDNIDSDIDNLKREIERKNNDLVDYITTIKSDVKNSKFSKFNSNIGNQDYSYDNKGYLNNDILNNDLSIGGLYKNNGLNDLGGNSNDSGLDLSKLNKANPGKNVNLKSSSNMIYNRDELLQERLGNNDSKLGKYIGMGKNLSVESEFIPIKESKFF